MSSAEMATILLGGEWVNAGITRALWPASTANGYKAQLKQSINITIKAFGWIKFKAICLELIINEIFIFFFI